MNLQYIDFHWDITIQNDIKLVQEITFFDGKTELISYHVADCKLNIDPLITSLFINGKKYKYARLDKSEDKQVVRVVFNRRTFMRIIWYCATGNGYDVSLNDNDEFELISDIFNRLFK